MFRGQPALCDINRSPEYTLEYKDYQTLVWFLGRMETVGTLSERGLFVSGFDAVFSANEAVIAAGNLRQLLLWFGPKQTIVPELRTSIVIGPDFIRISRGMIEEMRAIAFITAQFFERE